MGKDRIFLSSPHMGGFEKQYIKEAFDSNWIAPLGPNVDLFEKEVCEYIGVKAGAATISGTSAIHMALKCVGINPGDRVFCSSLTFAASCNPIIYEQGIPVFIDSEPESWNMSPRALKKALTKSEIIGKLPKAVIVVNLYGQSADMDHIKKICAEYNLPIIEDSAESLGAIYKGKKSGSIGDYGVFSFNGNKIITTSGGGMIVSNNEEGIEKVKFWITQSREKRRYYEHRELGYNYRMSNILAGIGRGQLKVLDKRMDRKNYIFNKYKKGLKDIKDIEISPECSYGKSNHWLTCITLKGDSKVKPLDIIRALEKENIEARHIWKPMQLQPYYRNYNFYSHNDDGISVSEDIFNRGLCLPSDTNSTYEDIGNVLNIVIKLFDR